MSTRLQPYTLSFPPGYDEQAEFEAPFRGYLPGVIVELEDGARHRHSFIDLVRLEQGLADNAGAGHPYYAEKGACRGSRSLHRGDSTGRAGFMGRGVLPSESTRMREQARHVVSEFLGRQLLWEAAADPSARPRAGDPSRPMIGSMVVSRQEKDPFDGGRLRLTGVNLLAAKGHRRVALNWRHWCITSCLSSLSPSPRADTP